MVSSVGGTQARVLLHGGLGDEEDEREERGTDIAKACTVGRDAQKVASDAGEGEE